MRERCVLSAFIERKRKRLIDLDRRNLILRSTGTQGVDGI